MKNANGQNFFNFMEELEIWKLRQSAIRYCEKKIVTICKKDTCCKREVAL